MTLKPGRQCLRGQLPLITHLSSESGLESRESCGEPKTKFGNRPAWPMEGNSDTSSYPGYGQNSFCASFFNSALKLGWAIAIFFNGVPVPALAKGGPFSV